MMTLDPKRRLKRPMVYELVPGIMTVEYDPDVLKSGGDPWKILNIVIKVAERNSLAVLVDFGNLGALSMGYRTVLCSRWGLWREYFRGHFIAAANDRRFGDEILGLWVNNQDLLG